MNLFLFFCGLSVLAASFTASVDKKEIAWNETVELSLKIQGSTYSDLQLPLETADYRTIAQATENNIKIDNGVMRQERTLKMGLLPKHQGEMKIPAISIKIDNNIYQSSPISVKVLDPNQSSSKVNLNRKINEPFAITTISKKGPYKHEQILFKLKIYHKGNIKETKIPNIELNDFLKEQIQKAYEYTEVYEGVEYAVYELDYILFPLKSGSIIIPPVELELITVESPDYNPNDPFAIFANAFMIEKPLVLKSEPISIMVKELPPAPAGFNGYVGDLSVISEIDKNKIEAGDSVTFTGSLYGNGNLKFLDLDLVPDSSQYELFKDKDNISSEIENFVKLSQITQKLAIVPNRDGKVSFTTKKIISFNPLLGKYETHGGKNFVIDVKKGSGFVNKKVKKSAITKQNKPAVETKKEILQISVNQALRNGYQEIPVAYPLSVIAVLNLIAFFIYIFNLIVGIRNKRLNDKGEEKIKFSKIEKKILQANTIADVSKTMKEVITKLEKQITNENLNQELKNKTTKFLHKCDQGNYGLVNYSVEELQEEGIELVRELRKHARRK